MVKTIILVTNITFYLKRIYSVDINVKEDRIISLLNLSILI